MKFKYMLRCPMKLSKQLLYYQLFIAFLTLTACGQDYNSNTADRPVPSVDLGEGVSDSDAGARFCAARSIYQENCFSCHPGWADLETDQQWVDKGLVVPGNTQDSLVINRLINSGSTMPLGGSALPDAQYQMLLDWVEQLSLEQ